MTKIDELLAVLDMPEEEQWGFLCSHQRIQEMCGNQLDAYCQKKYKRMVLADLAFRLRDKVGIEKFVNGLFMIMYTGTWEYQNTGDISCVHLACLFMWHLKQEAVVDVIAALIAKELAGKEIANGS